MNENWILIIKFLLGGGGLCGLFYMVARIAVAYIQKNNERKLTIKKFDIDGREIEYTFTAHTASEEETLLQLFTPQLQLLQTKSRRNRNADSRPSLPGFKVVDSDR